MKALAAMPSAATALPALKPYQPTHSMPVPTMVSTRLCGRKARCAEAGALAEDEAEHQRRPARGHVHDGAAGEVDRLDGGVGVPDAVHEAVDAPDHVGQREVDDEHPAATMNSMTAEYFMRSAMAPTIRAGRDDGEHQLVHREHVLRDPVRRSRCWAPAPTPLSNANLRPPRKGEPRREGEAVADSPPEDGDEAGAAEALGQHRQHVLAADQAAVEQRQAGQGHEQHQRGADHHQAVVAGAGGVAAPWGRRC